MLKAKLALCVLLIPGISQGILSPQRALATFKQYFLTREAQSIHQSPTLIEINDRINSANAYYHAITQAANNPHSSGIVIILNATSGSLGACQTLYHTIKRAAQKTQVVVYIETACCREAYLVAAAADLIVANEQAVIGIIGTTYIYKETVDKDIYYFYTGKFTPLGEGLHSMTNELQLEISQLLDQRYNTMCDTIAQARNLDFEERDHWANGKTFLAQDALNSNLIDCIGGLEDACDALIPSSTN